MAWNPCGPVAGTANKVIASIRNLNRNRYLTRVARKNYELVHKAMDATRSAPGLVPDVPNHISRPVSVLLHFFVGGDELG